jgi:hypothetical protein
MGIDYDSRLIYGWTVEYELLMDFLIKNKIGTCGGYYVDMDSDKLYDDPKADAVKITENEEVVEINFERNKNATVYLVDRPEDATLLKKDQLTEEEKLKVIKIKKNTKRLQCVCGEGCWSKKNINKILGPGIYIRGASPYYDCDSEERTYSISLIKYDNVTISELLAISSKTIEQAKKLATLLNSSPINEATIYSLAHIW